MPHCLKFRDSYPVLAKITGLLVEFTYLTCFSILQHFSFCAGQTVPKILFLN